MAARGRGWAAAAAAYSRTSGRLDGTIIAATIACHATRKSTSASPYGSLPSISASWCNADPRPLISAGSPGFFFWLLAGGIAYSVGAIVYAKKWPRGGAKVFGFHEIWHLFVMAGSFAHFWAILAYVARPS